MPVFLPGESHEQNSLAGYSLWGGKDSNITEATEQACMLQRNITSIYIYKISMYINKISFYTYLPMHIYLYLINMYLYR